MSLTEGLAIFVGLVVGYWVVSAMMSGKATSNALRQPDVDRSQAGPLDNPDTRTQSKSWNTVLGVLPNATTVEIRSAYRQQMSQHHPDKVASLGVELRMFSEGKAKEITEAYRQALHEHDAVE